MDKVEWVLARTLKPNNYNPNSVAPPEMQLLKISILENGFTQPVVVTKSGEIVDGFHRWTLVMKDKEINELTEGKVPVVVLFETDAATRKMATICHNRARGTHGVLRMAEIVQSLFEEGLKAAEIGQRLQMEPEEVVRLLNRQGIHRSKYIADQEFSKGWIPDK